MSDQQKFMEAYDMLANLAKKNPLMSKLWTDAQITLLKEAKEIYFALKNETTNDNNKSRAVSIKQVKFAPPLTVDPVKVAAATQVANNFLNDPKQVGKFTQISKATLVNDILAKIQNPVLINQGVANLCGPNAFASTWAMRDPKAYAEGVIKLYLGGEATIGGVNISVNSDNYNQPPTKGLSPTDYILLPAIRNGNNTIFTWWYDPYSDYGYTAFTTPSEMETWLESVDNSTVKRYESDDITPQELSRRYNNGASIIFLVAWTRFSQGSSKKPVKGLGKSQKPNSPVGDHYITLASEFIFNSTTFLYDFKIWNWGSIDSQSISWSQFQSAVHEIFILDNE